ncbi:hypothetical protein GCM10010276_54980 [Streptomyces longisporus]|uniref:Uncharacterized protein n=1 Tax=Streptomyces longisporus TaxID=1948 RepID=A0ABN3MLR6_STRLO
MVSAVCSRSSASLGFAVSDRAVRSSTGCRALTYDANDGYGRVSAAGSAAVDALVQTGVVMAPRYERGYLRLIGRRSRSRVPLRL